MPGASEASGASQGPGDSPEGHRCPECGAGRGPDNTPSCACGRVASDALRDARTAEQAAAEDFDPLRIRPYIDLNGTAAAAAATPAPAPQPPPAGGQAPDPDATMTLRAVSAPLPMEVPTPVPGPDPGHVEAFEGGSGAAGPSATGAFPDRVAPGPSRRRRKGLLIAAGGAVVTVLAAAGFAGGLLSYDKPSRDTAMPDDIREAVPDVRTSGPSGSPGSPSAVPHSPSASVSLSASPSTSPSVTPSPSASDTTSATPSAPGGTEGAAPSGTPTATTTPDDDRSGDGGGDGDGEGEGGVVLRRGDQGPEVTELQLRLSELRLYNGRVDDRFGRDLENAVTTYQWARGVRVEEGWGVYDGATREMLERETSEP
ncbi:peptidoglycan-binding protein [Streptomyces sp. NPDC093252]|uniref:peptidoglycan-binding domain-containing protein n=1 Tax=Streptomyces sp. NPDC093252 TaxID=3154980 RepID=UPI0034409267